MTGTGFVGVSEVPFFATPGTAVAVSSPTQLTVATPARPADVVKVYVSTASGTSAPVAADRYVFGARPTVTAVAPDSGPAAGGTQVTVTGSGFVGVSQVRFSRTPGAAVTVTSPTQLSVTAPAHVAGAPSA